MNIRTSHRSGGDSRGHEPLNPSVQNDKITRRGLLAVGAATGAAAPALLTFAPAEAAGLRVFRHGVASGDPHPTSVVLWTRATPTERAVPGSGVGPEVRVTWEVATDREFRHVVRRGTALTGPGRDHTVKVEADRLQPARWYYYRFHCRDAVSRVGRTRTAPAPTAVPGHLRLGVVSCANYQAGYFNAYRALARRDDLHAILHLGDYLYEYGGPGSYAMGSDNVMVRAHKPAREMVSLSDYRQRHAQYKRDPDLQDLHAKYPFVVTWDDHETTNDAWRAGAENHQPRTEGDYAARKARAARVYDEWMPVRMGGTAAVRDGTRLYRRLRFGRLAEISMLDLRSYRTEQASQAETGDPEATITGGRQLEWLKDGLATRGAQWKIVGNPVMIAPVNLGTLPADLVHPVNDVTGLLPPDGVAWNVDQWDGYTADRREIFQHIRDRQITDVVFVTGDIHSGWACELPVDPGSYPANDRTVGVELVATSVTSNNLKDILGTRELSPVVVGAIQTANRHVKYLNFDDHGFSVLDVTSARTQMDWFVTGARDRRDGGATWERSYRSPAGSGRLVRAERPVGQ